MLKFFYAQNHFIFERRATSDITNKFWWKMEMVEMQRRQKSYTIDQKMTTEILLSLLLMKSSAAEKGHM